MLLWLDYKKKLELLVRIKNNGVYSALRGIPIDSYIIFYRLLENSIVIVLVVSGYRDIESLFLDLDQ